MKKRKNKIKSLLSILLLSLLCINLLSGCKKDNQNTRNNQPEQNKLSGQDIQNNSDNHSEEVNQDGQKNESEDENQSEPNNQENQPELNIAALKGPSAIGLVKLMKDSKDGNTNNKYNFTILGTADEISAGLIKGDIQIAAVPCNLASVLYNKTEGNINIAAINITCVLYIVEKGESIQSVEDLKGKTIYSTGKGTTPEFTLNYLLRSAGIDPEKDVTIEYKSESTEVAAVIQEKEGAVAMLPQPYVTTVMMQDESIRIALDVAKEWENYTEDDSSVVTGAVVVNREFYDNNKNLVDEFLSEYKASTEYVNNNIDEAAGYVEEFDIFKAAVAKKAIPYCNIVFIQGQEMKGKVEKYLNVLFDQNPASVGGAMPGEDFYMIGE